MNLGGHHRRSIGTGWQVGFGNIGGIIAVYAFQTRDAPRYKVCLQYLFPRLTHASRVQISVLACLFLCLFLPLLPPSLSRQPLSSPLLTPDSLHSPDTQSVSHSPASAPSRARPTTSLVCGRTALGIGNGKVQRICPSGKRRSWAI